MTITLHLLDGESYDLDVGPIPKGDSPYEVANKLGPGFRGEALTFETIDGDALIVPVAQISRIEVRRHGA